MIVPMFPLPDAFLFPGWIMPLHVFEPRYLRMVEDLLDSPGRLVVATQIGEEDEPAPPEVAPVAGLGEIARHEKLDDGRYILVVQGLGRVRLEEAPSSKPYRLARIEPLDETAVPESESDELRERLTAAVRTRARDGIELPDDLGVEMLTDVLLMHMQLPPTRMAELFSTAEIASRAREALVEHERERGEAR